MISNAITDPKAGPLPTDRRAGLMFARAVRKRCPLCGGGSLFSRWILMVESCPTCGLRTRRGEDGYTLGALALNLLIAEAITMTVFITTLVRTWPDPPWDWLQISGPIEAIVIPLVVWPFARTLFLALDLSFRPPTAADFEERSE
jgi:uncharacterized protein (DUF983 family)